MPTMPGTGSPGGPMPPLPPTAWLAQRLERLRERGRDGSATAGTPAGTRGPAPRLRSGRRNAAPGVPRLSASEDAASGASGAGADAQLHEDGPAAL